MQEYFFPKEDVLALERQEKWAKQSKSKMKSGRKNSVNPYNPELEGPSPPSSVFAPGRLSHDQGGNHPTSTHTSPGTNPNSDLYFGNQIREIEGHSGF